MRFFGAENWHRIARFVPGRTGPQCQAKWNGSLDGKVLSLPVPSSVLRSAALASIFDFIFQIYVKQPNNIRTSFSILFLNYHVLITYFISFPFSRCFPYSLFSCNLFRLSFMIQPQIKIKYARLILHCVRNIDGLILQIYIHEKET